MMIADMEANKKLSPIVFDLFLRGRKLNISLVSIWQSYLPKTKSSNVTHYFIMKIPEKRELQQIVLNDLSDIDFKDFMKLYNDYTKELFLYLVIDSTLSSDNPLRFRKNLL